LLRLPRRRGLTHQQPNALPALGINNTQRKTNTMTQLEALEREREQITARITELSSEIATIAAQVEHAEACGDYDRHWAANATLAKRHKAVERDRLQFKLGPLGRRIKDVAMAENERKFSDTAKRVLPRETFDKILAAMAAN